MRSWTPISGAACLLAAVAQAQVLLPGDITGAPLDDQATIGGTIVDSSFLGYIQDNLSGGVSSIVYSGEPGNPNAGGLTFLYVIANAGTDEALTLTVPSFSGYSVKVNENTSGGGVTSLAAARSAGDGDDVNLFFSGLGSSLSSSFLLIHTDATAFHTVTATIGGLNGAASTTVFAPVPEPSAYAAMVGIGLAGYGMLRRYRRS